MIRTYGLLVIAALLIAAGVATYTPGGALIVVGLVAGFIWWDDDEGDQ